MVCEQSELTVPFRNETSTEFISFDQLEFAELRAGFDYWRTLRGTRRYPAKEELQLREISAILRHMVLARVLDNANDFLLKVVGDEVGRAYRAPLNNRRLSEIAMDLPNTVRRWSEVYRQVALSGEPLAVRVVVGTEAPELNFIQAETICLPFGRSVDSVDHLVTFGKRTA